MRCRRSSRCCCARIEHHNMGLRGRVRRRLVCDGVWIRGGPHVGELPGDGEPALDHLRSRWLLGFSKPSTRPVRRRCHRWTSARDRCCPIGRGLTICLYLPRDRSPAHSWPPDRLARFLRYEDATGHADGGCERKQLTSSSPRTGRIPTQPQHVLGVCSVGSCFTGSATASSRLTLPPRAFRVSASPAATMMFTAAFQSLSSSPLHP